MARKRERAFAAFGAVLFLLTSSALTIAVVWSLIQQHNSNAKSTDQTSSTNSSNASSSNSSRSNSEQNVNNSSTTGKLQGTKLADFTPVSNVTDLQKTDTTVGTGQEVTSSNQTVTVDYTGAVAATGVIFQSSKDSGQKATFALNQVIPGWTQGIPGMKVGGTRRLVIPANLAYGANPPSGSGIPANAALVFDVTLYSVSN